jgi:hypothetical protein
MEDELVNDMKNLNINSDSNNQNNDISDNININTEKEKNNDNSQESTTKQKPKNTKGKLIIPLKSKRVFKNEDFDVISLSGKGAYGMVLKVKLKEDTSDKLYAIKTMDIKALTNIKKLYQAYLECDILSQIQSPYIVNIFGSFTEHGKIYIVMEYLSKGDFSDFLRLNFPLQLDTIKFYTA